MLCLWPAHRVGLRTQVCVCHCTLGCAMSDVPPVCPARRSSVGTGHARCMCPLQRPLQCVPLSSFYTVSMASLCLWLARTSGLHGIPVGVCVACVPMACVSMASTQCFTWGVLVCLCVCRNRLFSPASPPLSFLYIHTHKQRALS